MGFLRKYYSCACCLLKNFNDIESISPPYHLLLSYNKYLLILANCTNNFFKKIFIASLENMTILGCF